jgi:hypothetical protein
MLTVLRRPNNLSSRRHTQAQEGVRGIRRSSRSRKDKGVEKGRCKTRNGAGLDCRDRRTKLTARPASRQAVKTNPLGLAGAKSLFISRDANTAAFIKLLSA